MPEFKGRLRTPRLPSAPSSPITGEMYYDTTTNQLLWWNGTAWTLASGGVDLVYNGQYPAGTPYTDGDVVIGADNIAYLCVRPTSAAPTPWTGVSGPVGPPGPQGPQGATGLTGPAGAGVPTVQNGKWLKGSGGAAVWAAITVPDMPIIPACRVWSNTAGSVPNSTYTVVPGFSAHVDYNTDLVVYDNGLGIQTAGIYLFELKLWFGGANAGQHRLCAFSFNGVAWSSVGGVITGGGFGAGSVRCNTTMVRRCVVGDSVNPYVYQDSGGLLGVGGDGPGGPEMTATWLGRGA